MKMLDEPRKAKEIIRYQFHMELTLDEIRKIRLETGPRGVLSTQTTGYHVLSRMVAAVPQG